LQGKKALNIGVIGMGKMGLLHASILNTIPNVKITAIYDRSSIMKRFAAKALGGIIITDSFDEFAASAFDAIYVTTPIPTHYSIVKDIYSRGITRNIFVEKTLTSNHEQSAALCQEAKKAGGVTMVGYMSRFSPTFQKAKALLQEGAVGNLISFKAYAYASDFAEGKGKSLKIKGSPNRDLGSHVIDLGNWFFGAALQVGTSAQNSESGSCFKVFNSRGLTGEFDISWSKADYRLPEFGLAITGSKGIIKVNADFAKLEKNTGDVVSWFRQDLHDNVPFLLGATEYYREDAHFVSTIINGGSADPDFVAASKVDLLIDHVEGRMTT